MNYDDSDVIVLNDSELKKYQFEVLNIARDVIRVLDQNQINYSLSGGSILGAIRHQGFITWDDDIDLNIPRADYNKLLQIFDEELGDKYYLQTPEMFPELGIMVTQIRKRNTVARRKYDWNLKECGISIDIYIVENVYDNSFKRFFQKELSMVLSFAISSVRYVHNKELPESLKRLEGRQINYSKSKIIVGRVLNIIPLRLWIKWCTYWNSCCKDNNSKLVAIPTGRKHFSGEIYNRSGMCVYQKTKFETEEFNIPVWAKGYLEMFYGDYMKIPPVENREKHLFLELKY